MNMTDDDLRQVFQAYRKAANEHDAALAHPDRGKRTAAGFAAEGILRHTADALRAAGAKWESTRLAYLAAKEERDERQP
jgi:hypothetical protein